MTRGVLPNICHIGICAALKGMVLAPFWSEDGYSFAHFGLESGMVLQGNYTVVYKCVCRFNYKRIRKKEIFSVGFSNLSNEDIISVNENMHVAFCDHLQV